MKLIPATIKDAQFLFKLKNDKVMRKFAVVTHDKIKYEDHLDWLKYNIQTMQIITEKGKKLGMVRIANDREVSINLHPSSRGMGLGSKVVKSLPKGLWAKIVNGNVASMRCFLSSGFQIVDYKDNYYVLQN